MNHNDKNLRYDEAVISFAASALDMSRVDYDYGVINFAEATMAGIKRLIDRFVSEHSSAKDYIAKYGKDEFGAYFLCDVGGFGDGLDEVIWQSCVTYGDCGGPKESGHSFKL